MDLITDLFRIPFMQHALIAGCLIGVMCGVLGVYVVLNRIVFVTAALAQMASAGIALGFLLSSSAVVLAALSNFFHVTPTQVHNSMPLILAMAFAFVGVVIFSLRFFSKRIPPDSVLGIAYTAAWAVSILFVSKSSQGIEEVAHLLHGNLLTTQADQIWLMAAVFALVALMHYLFAKEFMFVSFDAEMARTQGYRAGAWNLLLYVTIGLVIAVAIRSGGILLVFAFLVIPAIVALTLSQELKKIFWIAAGVSLLSIFLGLYSTLRFDLTAEPTIVAVLAGILLVVYVLKKFTVRVPMPPPNLATQPRATSPQKSDSLPQR